MVAGPSRHTHRIRLTPDVALPQPVASAARVPDHRHHHVSNHWHY
jgi:hypothetical protein